ncbi:cytochrome P450 [Acidimangrovimonas sediminis]|uniref:cytochrome P450 n=1 Tax=Acidimangrovimonas sediminis TaxID=2056283 RepID=UPI001304AF53|nr:cytochrome P450 [Acidimangrovimonas sediminis]
MLDSTEAGSGRDWTAIVPPERPYPGPLFLYHFVRNPLRCLPKSAYEEPIVPYRIGALRTAWVTDPALTERIFLAEHANFPKPPLESRVFSEPLGQSILTSQGEDWRWQRQAVAGLFRHEEILRRTPDMARAARNLLARWQAEGARGPRRIDRDLTGATYEAISHTLFGGAAMPEAGDIQTAVDEYLNATSWEIAAALSGLPGWGWHPGRARLSRAARRMRAAVERLVDRWGAGPDRHGNHLMGRLLEAEEPGRGPISRERLVNNLLTFLNAGHETTGKALIWTLYLLSREPRWQERLRDEAFAVAGNAPIGPEHVERLTLTRQIFEEAMRLYAPAPVLTRQAVEACDLGGVRIDAGEVIFIPIWAIHRHRALWPEPEKFRPERFAPAARGAIRRTQYLPFGFGPRICIGATFARIEGCAMLATLLRGARFDWPGGPPPEPLGRVTLWPRGGMRLNVTLLH